MITLDAIDGVVQGEIPADAIYTRTTATQCFVYMPGDEVPAVEAALVSDVPTEVTARQFVVALIRSGLWDAVNAAVAAADIETQQIWARAQSFERSNPMLAAMAAALGYTAEQVDDVFRLAATI